MDTCPRCGVSIRWPGTPSPEQGLLLPSGPRGALLAIVITGLLFAGIWTAFDRITSADSPPAAAAPPVTTPTPSAPPASSSTVDPTPSPTPDVADPTPTAAPDPAVAWGPVLAQAADGLVRVTATACDATRQAGSGFLVSPRRVVTAAHLLTDASRLEVGGGDATRSARLLGADAELDLALLELDRPLGGRALELVERPVAIGQRVAPAALAEDGPLVVPSTVSGVDVDVVTRRGNLADVVRTDAAVASEVAGAPLLTPAGRVAGVVLADHVRSAVGDLGFALPATRVAERVDSWSRGRPPPRTSCTDQGPAATPSPTPRPQVAAPPPDPEPPAPSPSPTPDPDPPPPDPEPQPEDPEVRDPEPRDPGAWIAIIESLPTDQYGRPDAVRRARAYDDSVPDRVRVLRSGNASSLNPGYWVVYTGPHDDRDAARMRCRRYGSGAPACYARLLAP